MLTTVKKKQAMMSYLLSLAIGLLVGFIYSFFDARSLAQLIIALVGWLGILVGEQVLPHENSIKSVVRALHLFDVACAMAAKFEKGETDNAGGPEHKSHIGKNTDMPL